MYGVKKFHCYLYGHHFTIRSDHQPLRHLFGEKKGIPIMAASRIQRWALTLSAYEYSIEYCPGKNVQDADALSRLPLPQKVRVPIPGDLHLLREHLDTASPVTAKEIAQWTERDPVLARVRRFVKRGWPSSVSEEALQPYSRRKEELSVLDGCLLWGSRVVVPRPGREALVEELHGGHPGVVCMKALARSYMWWPGISKDLEQRVHSCPQCQQSRNAPPPAPLHPWEWPREPWARLHLDFARPFQGRMFLVLVDAYTKWLEVLPMSSTTTAATVEKLRHIFAVHGLPQRIVTDNGPQFTSREFAEFLEGNGVVHVQVAPYHPSSNGLAERAVQTFKSGLQRIRTGTLGERLCRFLFTYRITPHATTGQSPAELLFNRRPRSRLDLVHPDTAQRVRSQQDKQVQGRSQGRARQLEQGQKVYVKNFGGGPTWLPGVVQDRTGPVSYRVQMEDGRDFRRHVDHLRN